MQYKVIDASVALKWFVAEDAKQTEALKILDEIQSSPAKFAVPDLFFNEMLAVFCRILNDTPRIQRYIKILEELGFYRVGNGSELLGLAAEISVEHGLTGYDAIYAATAKLIGGVWVTADLPAHKRIAKLKISTVL